MAEPSFGRGTSRGARRCYIDASTAGVADVPYRSRMDDPAALDDTVDDGPHDEELNLAAFIAKSVSFPGGLYCR